MGGSAKRRATSFRRVAGSISVLATLAVCLLPSASAADRGVAGMLQGVVRAAGDGVADATVQLMRAGTTPETAEVLSTTSSGRSGRFRFRVPSTVFPDDVLYITAAGGELSGRELSPDVELAAALGDLRAGRVVVNELTTVASGYSLAQFVFDGAVGGPGPGLSNAARMARNFVDLATGRTARFLAQHPNGGATETMATFNSLASIIAGCATATNDCNAFLTAVTDAWGTRPETTWQAMSLLPTNPAGDPVGVFGQVPPDPAFQPVRSSAPDAWVLALRFYGNGRQFNGPGNVAFDANGLVWSNNNAQWARDPRRVCPGLEIFRLDPYQRGAPLETFTGGGLNGSGFGISLDPDGHVWVANFGFTGPLCPVPPTSNSVSEFRPDGAPQSGPNGYTDGPLSWPQGIKSDVTGNIWIGSCGNDSLVMYPNGDHRQATVVGDGIDRAFDMAQNADGNVFVTANGGDQVFGFAPDGQPLPGSPYGDSSMFSNPLGAASDSLGNVWVSNSGVVRIPCAAGETLEVPADDLPLQGSVTQVQADGTLAQFPGAGMTIPWGIAVDGDDNLWVANFSGERLSHLCGARASTCPTGQTGAPLSPDSGYTFDGLQRNTGVQVDPSGNVWLTNNYERVPFPPDPFGDGLVAYIGMAAPVRTPLVGPPQQP